MVKITRVTFHILLMLSGATEAAQFEILPKFCMIAEDAPCITTLQIRWRAETPVCLLNETLHTVLHCAADTGSYQLPIQSKTSVVFSLIEQDSQRVLASREFKVMQHQQQALQQRRLSWSIFR